jgi:hypothetical protein
MRIVERTEHERDVRWRSIATVRSYCAVQERIALAVSSARWGGASWREIQFQAVCEGWC